MTPKDRILAHLRQAEALRLKPYLDCCGQPWRQCVCDRKGKLTIGYGRNLDDVGLSHAEASYLLDRDLERAAVAVVNALSWAGQLDDVRLAVLIEMAFNLGIGGLLRFRRMLTALEARQFSDAAREMLDSTWAGQVGTRAQRLAREMESGTWG